MRRVQGTGRQPHGTLSQAGRQFGVHGLFFGLRKLRRREMEQ